MRGILLAPLPQDSGILEGIIQLWVVVDTDADVSGYDAITPATKCGITRHLEDLRNQVRDLSLIHI